MDSSAKEIAENLLTISRLIEGGQFAEASECLRILATEHPEWVDERLQAELHMIMRQMEYKIELGDYAYLRSLSLAYKYCEMNYVDEGIRRAELLYADSAGEQGGLLQRRLPEAETIWWCWLQGFDNAPEIVKRCYHSLAKLGRRIVILDEHNLREYVELPDHIQEKYERGILSEAHYSDLVRLELLTRRGGTWIDATTWISGTERILPVLESENLFMFRAGNVSEYITLDNWFMHAAVKSHILEATRELLYTYWEKEDEAKHYFIFHLMQTMACRHYPEEFSRIPLFSNEPCHVLQHELQNPFRKERWEQITGMSDVHKLTYKLEAEPGDGTFWKHLCGGD